MRLASWLLAVWPKGGKKIPDYYLLLLQHLSGQDKGKKNQMTNTSSKGFPFNQHIHHIHTGNSHVSTIQPAIDELSQYKSVVSCK